MSYTKEQRREAFRVFKRTKSVTKTIRELGYPGRRTMHRWVREAVTPGRRRRQAKTVASYPIEVKLQAVELSHADCRQDEIVAQCGVRSTSNVYSWVQLHREEGERGLMSKKRTYTTCSHTDPCLI